jgi:hypothetical protein
MASSEEKTAKLKFHFDGFEAPRFTQVPDQLFDVLMPELSESELKVLLYVVRRTFGFGKSADAISINQMINGITTREGRVLDRGTGLSRSSVRRGVAGLVEKGILVVSKMMSEEGDYETNIYQLRFKRAQGVGSYSNHPAEGVVPASNHPDLNLGLGVEPNSNPQQTVEQQTEIQDRAVEYSKDTPNHFDEVGARMLVLPFVEDFAREFNDQAPLRSSVSRMVNLYRASGLDEVTFIDVMYQARARTKEYAGAIKAEVPGGGPWKSKARMGYFFAIVTDLIGAKAGEGEGHYE